MPQELVERAQRLGYRALAITDECSVAGVVRAHVRGEETASIKLIIGAEFRLDCGLQLRRAGDERAGLRAAVPLITRGRRAATKGSYRLVAHGRRRHSLEHCLLIWLPAARLRTLARRTRTRSLAARALSGRLWLGVELLCEGADREQAARSSIALAAQLGIPLRGLRRRAHARARASPACRMR